MPDRRPVSPAQRVVVVGVAGDDLSVLAPPAIAALESAEVVVGSPRHLSLVPSGAARRVVLDADIGAAVDAVVHAQGLVCVLASGDPGFFGIVRPLARRLGAHVLEVHPAPSSVARAFARLGVPWDDAVVVSAHGRDLEDALRHVRHAPKAAVLVSPENPPEALGKALLSGGAETHDVYVCSALDTVAEAVHRTDLVGLAAGTWDPRSVVVLLRDEAVAAAPGVAWGLADARFAHRAGMVTTAEVRAVVLGKLGLEPEGVLWDVGAGSASVAIEAARLAPAVQVFAVERDPSAAEQARQNVVTHGVGGSVTVVAGEAPAALADLPDPGRVFVGGGGTPVLDAALARLRPGGRVVATYAALDRAESAERRLGNLVQLSLARGERLPDGGLRLVAHNPVFVVWGPA